MNRDEHEPLDSRDPMWELLGKSRQPKERPFFVSKVMRAVREESQPAGVWAWLRVKWVVPAAITACAVVGAFVMMQPPGQTVKQTAADAGISETEIEDVIDDSIDQLLAAEDHSEWLSADPSSFLP